MEECDTVVAVFVNHEQAEAAVKKLAAIGLDNRHISVVGKAYHDNAKFAGFYGAGDRIKFWGELGAFWGGLSGWLGGLVFGLPLVGHFVALGAFANILVSVIESAIEGAIGGAILAGGLGALGAALYSIGIPEDSAIAYETHVKANRILVMASGSAEEVERARVALSEFNPLRLDLHKGARTADSGDHRATVPDQKWPRGLGFATFCADLKVRSFATILTRVGKLRGMSTLKGKSWMHLPDKRTFRGFLALASSLPIAFASPARAAPSVVIDVASGQILEQEEATAVWYPASVTKLMTVYVALDAVRQGRLTFDTPLVVSARAAKMAPSKMGFRPGSEVTLRNALVMLMVKSANDVAVTVAEGVSGSVEAFADEMNKASAALGMRESNWVNPNGLPDPRHVTSARDLAILGRALLQQFPESASLFNIGAMQLGGRITANHNGMLGRYPGADGMKTGFTCPAGYNLVASATHGGQKLIAVVLGAPTPASRTAKTAALLDRAFQTGSPMGALESLPSGNGAPPDLRATVCGHRAKAAKEFMAEVEDMTIPINAAPTGNPVVDALAGGRQSVSVKDLARLPRPLFTPVVVYAGRAPGYEGPVARARPAGAPIGAAAEATAYTGEKKEGTDASPISQPAPDAEPLRAAAADQHAKHAKHAKVAAPEATEAPPPAKIHAAKAKGKAKTAALETKKPNKKPESKAHKEHAAAHPAKTGKAAPHHAEKQQKGKAHAAKTGDAGETGGAGDAGQ